MICCDNTKCPIVWFHKDCLKIVTIPTGKWYCPDNSNCKETDLKPFYSDTNLISLQLLIYIT